MVILPEQIINADGRSSAVELPPDAGALELSLGITRSSASECLDVAVEGSRDGQVWGEAPLAQFQRKLYNGVYRAAVDPGEARYVRVRWKVDRWGACRDREPAFGIYVLADAVAMARSAGQ
jgi:hypothetical protein